LKLEVRLFNQGLLPYVISTPTVDISTHGFTHIHTWVTIACSASKCMHMGDEGTVLPDKEEDEGQMEG
jgi:hypothetical protein